MRVYECRGSDPASSSDCYGSPGFRGVDASGDSPRPTRRSRRSPTSARPTPSTPRRTGPANWQDNVTRADGSGEVTIQVFTQRESAGLGCDVDSPCSIVVVPNYGRNQANVGDTEDVMDAPWAWASRTVVPLSFQSVDDACSLGGTCSAGRGQSDGRRSAGVVAREHLQAAEQGRRPSTTPRSASRRPVSTSGRGPPTSGWSSTRSPQDEKASGVVYSPVSVTGLVVAFQIDDATRAPGHLDAAERAPGREADHRVVPLRW